MSSSNMASDSQVPTDTDILVVGGGPVGMFTAFRLAKLGQTCVLVEQSLHTTIYPKMEYISHRTMEIYRRVGLADHVQPRGVPDNYGFSEIFTTGLGEENLVVTRIERPSPAELRKSWAESNDGSHPLEPHMRQSQIIFEAILKQLVQKEPLVQAIWGATFESLTENDDGVLSTILHSTGKRTVIKSRYVIGCDGAGSKVRLCAGLESPRHSLPLKIRFVHFKSRDLEKMRSQGDFWHMMILNGSGVIAQDEIETYTLHRVLAPEFDSELVDPVAFIKESLGGMGGPFDINVDEVIVTDKWQSDLSIANSFRSTKGRVFLAGDSAHQLSPVGGHGLNSGIHDAFDLTWKLALVLRGWGGEGLLDSYSKERRPVAELNFSMVEKGTTEVLIPWMTKGHEMGSEKLLAATEDGQRHREEMRDFLVKGRWVHEQTGTVMGYRYNGSPIVVTDPSTPEPPTSITEYIPSTWPGARAPHVYLSDGKTSVFDLYGPGFSIVDFTETGKVSDEFVGVARDLDIPLTQIHLAAEPHCRSIWERDVVLVRPDGFVAWRCPPQGAPSPADAAAIKNVLLTATGRSA